MLDQVGQSDTGITPTPAQASLHVCHLIHSLRPGGAEQLLVVFAGACRPLGIETTVVSLMGIEESRYAAALRRAGARVISVGLRSRWDIRGFQRAAALLEELRPDVLQTHLKHADLIGAWASRSRGIPMVSTLHVIEDDAGPVERFKRKAGASARLRQASRTVAVSDAQRRWYLDAFHPDPDRVVTIHNGIAEPLPLQAGERDAIRATLGVRPGEVLVTMAGVMRPGKGHADLLSAARLLPGDLPVRIAMVGDGELAGEIATAVREDARLVGRVILPGWWDDVDRLLAASDIFVHPTRSDALPTAVIHALAGGLPVVASDVGGVPELVDESVGKLVPPADPSALAKALVALAESPDRRAAMGRRAKARYQQDLTATAWVGRLGALYREVIAE